MKTIAVITPILLCLTHSALAEKTGTLEEFSTVKFEKGSLVVVDRLDGEKVKALIGEAEECRTLQDGERVRVPLGRISFFQNGKQAVSFRPLEDQRGFLVRKTFDDRKTGGGLRAVQFRLTIGKDGSLVYGEADSMKENSPKVY